jgi:hypothetical protein
MPLLRLGALRKEPSDAATPDLVRYRAMDHIPGEPQLTQQLSHVHTRARATLSRSRATSADPGFRPGLAGHAEIYADQNERDYGALKAAADSGRIEVRPGL